jgi:hypothetical protein
MLNEMLNEKYDGFVEKGLGQTENDLRSCDLSRGKFLFPENHESQM